MLSPADRSKAAQILLAAEAERKPALQLSKTFPDITIEDAYAIQSEVTRIKVAAGHRVRGHKVGLTSKAMQQSSQIDEPDYGHLMDYMFIADGAKIPFERFIVPRVEIELAFVLGKPLKGPGVELVDVLRATEYVVPAMWCSRAPSPGRCGRRRAIRCAPTSARWVRSRSSSSEPLGVFAVNRVARDLVRTRPE